MSVFDHLPHPGNTHDAWTPVKVEWGCGHQTEFWTNKPVVEANKLIHAKECCGPCAAALLRSIDVKTRS